MMSRELRLSSVTAGNSLKPQSVSGAVERLEQAPFARLREAAQNGGRVEPSDVVAILAGIASNEMLAVERAGAQLSALGDFLLSNASPEPVVTLSLLERLTELHRRQKAEAKQTLELLHRLTSPFVAPVVNVAIVANPRSRGSRRSTRPAQPGWRSI